MNNPRDTTCVWFAFIAAFCSSVAVNNSGIRVSYIPPADLKSGIPEATETPAPVKIDIDFISLDWILLIIVSIFIS